MFINRENNDIFDCCSLDDLDECVEREEGCRGKLTVLSVAASPIPSTKASLFCNDLASNTSVYTVLSRKARHCLLPIWAIYSERWGL